MFGLGKKTVVEIGKWNNRDNDTPQGFRRVNGDAEAWANVGSVENAKKLFDLTDEQVAALRDCGFIDIDVDGEIGAVTLESGYGF